MPFWWIDVGATMQKIMLAAVDEGLGSGFAGGSRDIRAYLGIPDEFMPIGVMPVGSPLPDVRSPSLKRGWVPLEEFARWDRWTPDRHESRRPVPPSMGTGRREDAGCRGGAWGCPREMRDGSRGGVTGDVPREEWTGPSPVLPLMTSKRGEWRSCWREPDAPRLSPGRGLRAAAARRTRAGPRGPGPRPRRRRTAGGIGGRRGTSGRPHRPRASAPATRGSR